MASKILTVDASSAASARLTARHREYWRKTLALTGALLAVWFVVTFVIAYFARDLSFDLFGWPFAFYMAAQGSLIIYGWIIWYYAKRMRHLDSRYDEAEAQ